MTRGSRIVAIGGEDSASATPATETAPEIDFAPAVDDDEEPATQGRGWIGPALALLAIAGWSVFFVWSRQVELLAGAPPATWSGWLTDWSLPVLLVCTVWLLAMRHSRRETARFGDAARLLSAESARLEARLATVNAELSIARSFIEAQGRDLEALGRIATERLSENAERLQALIHQNGAQVEAIGTVSTTALDNMERLRGQLPVIASAAKDVANNIGNAGRTAQAQLQEMVQGFKRLNEFGQASERQVGALRAMVETAIGEFTAQAERMDELARTRFAALAEQGTEFRAKLDADEIAALAAVRSRASELVRELEAARDVLDRHEAESITSLRARLGAVRDESAQIGRVLREAETASIAAWQTQVERMEATAREAVARLDAADQQAVAETRVRLTELGEESDRLYERLAARSAALAEDIGRRREEAEEAQAAAFARLQDQFATLDAELARRTQDQQRRCDDLAAHGEAIAARIAGLGSTIAGIAGHGAEAEERLGLSLAALSRNLADAREALTGTDARIAELTDASVRLLELIQAGVQHSSHDLPIALATGENRLAELEQRIFLLRDTVDQARGGSEYLSAHVLATNEALEMARGRIGDLAANLQSGASEQDAALAGLAARLADLDGQTRTLAQAAQGELSRAIETLAAAARDAVATIGEGGTRAVSDIAASLGAQSGKAIEAVMQARAAEAALELEKAAAQAAHVSREAATQLRDQLAMVNELAGNLERRVAHARARAEEQVDNDFARRVALITESLNSNAIDIAKAMSADVSDTAWSAYLKGDRGIFTRRAVSLLDNAEAKAVLHLYEVDGEFRDHVARYIHDFEAMLRQVLSTRDGHALGVTLLSADMGKLYVALAQSIERLRA